jgi:hypothetical protein
MILAHGFTIPFLAELVSDRLVIAELSSAHDVRVQITDLGREALGQQAATLSANRGPDSFWMKT